MPDIVLALETPRATGSRPSRRLRSEGKVPATVYGLFSEVISASVNYSDLRSALSTEAGSNAVLRLQYGGGDHLALVREMQRHPIRGDVLHVDFLRVDPDVAVQVEVPVRLTGRASAVEEMNGIVDQDLFEVSVLSVPRSIPNELTVDISELTVGSSITVADMEFPDGVTCLAAPRTSVVSGIITRSALMDVEEETEEGEGEGEAEDVEGDEDSAEND